MTKVKHILKEFCSAKDILAINRLGLLSKGEERESQPIPWRHRLKGRERKELVRSEMRMSLHRPSSRMSARDKAKAVSTAQSPQTSRMGELLLHVHSKDGNSDLDSRLDRLISEERRLKHQIHHTRRSFLQQSQTLNKEPLILVERPPHPNVRTRAAFMARHGVDPELVSIPSYQRPLLTRARTPSTLTTIEAFTVETKKKKNVWEQAMEDKEELKFKSTAKPSAKLTDHEIKQLKIGYNIHKPTTESIMEPRRPVRHKKPKTKPEERPPLRRSSSDSGITPSVFLTELSKKHNSTSKTLDGRQTKAVAGSKATPSSTSGNTKQPPQQSWYPFPPAVPHGISAKKSMSPPPQKKRSRSAGAKDGLGPGPRAVKPANTTSRSVGTGAKKPQKTSATPITTESAQVRGKNMKEFLSVLLEDEDY